MREDICCLAKVLVWLEPFMTSQLGYWYVHNKHNILLLCVVYGSQVVYMPSKICIQLIKDLQQQNVEVFPMIE